MNDNPQPNWQPLSNMPMISSLIDEQLEDVKGQLETLQGVSQKAH